MTARQWVMTKPEEPKERHLTGKQSNNKYDKTTRRSPKGQVKLVLLWGLAECSNRKALRLRAQGVYSCKWPSLNVENNATSAVLCNGLKTDSF